MGHRAISASEMVKIFREIERTKRPMIVNTVTGVVVIDRVVRGVVGKEDWQEACLHLGALFYEEVISPPSKQSETWFPQGSLKKC